MLNAELKSCQLQNPAQHSAAISLFHKRLISYGFQISHNEKGFVYEVMPPKQYEVFDSQKLPFERRIFLLSVIKYSTNISYWINLRLIL